MKLNHDSITDRKHYCELIMDYTSFSNRKFYAIIIGLSESIDSNLDIEEKINKLNDLSFTYSIMSKKEFESNGLKVLKLTRHRNFYDALKCELE